MPAVLSIAMAAALLVQQAPPPPSLDFEFYRTRVQPILLAKRPGGVPCATCHARVANSLLRLQPLAPGTTSWSEEQSRGNFEALQLFVVPGEPTASRLLMHPLDRAAGGDLFHGGGKHWRSQGDPEWLTFTPDSKRVYVAAAGDNAVFVIDVKTMKEVARIPVGQVPKRNATAILQTN